MSLFSPEPGWTAVVIAGGRGSRLGHDDKAAITIGGTSALDHLLKALPDRVPVVVAGPDCPTQRPVTFRREWPLYGGPVAGIASGLEVVSTPVTALLGVDMPWAGALLERLIAEFASCDAAALVPVDGAGLRQPLCAVVRTEALRGALARLGDPRGRSLRELILLLDVHERPLSEAETRWVDDIDTQQDLHRARSTPLSSGVPAPLYSWVSTVCAELKLPGDPDLDVILDVARAAAYNIERPAAPVTTYLLGQAVAKGMDVGQAAARIQLLAATWPESAHQ
ncbi:MAG: molybdenum cofactor guanylyltransferase [Dermatophilaceae bacterium]|nr:molybdenum cofactor guanylyltransferase [Dermatophilaceae bacterium]